MDLKKRSREEIEERIEELEDLIAKNGVGSNYLSKAERIQRDVWLFFWEVLRHCLGLQRGRYTN